tara:strand:+ start:1588 stop:3066 length:1479 start_codon:yes stop_codon:yes gene_type:complete
MKQKSSYTEIIKGASLFGGVQVINIIIQIIRSKVIALLLGPSGIGVMGLFNSSLGLISSLTNFGLRVSAVKDIAAANGSQNKQRISITITILRRLVWVTGVLGTLMVLILSPWLSQLTFGNKDYTFAFIWLSITLLFQQLSIGQLVVLQGMRKLKLLAKANVMGSALGLIVTLPLYYIYGLDGIVPGIFVTSLIVLLLSLYFSSKIKLEFVKVTLRQTYLEGKNMLVMGFFISLSSLVTVGASYIVRVFISRIGSVEQVGLYTAGFAIINTYAGLIFSAMGSDYYPRLSEVSHNNKLCKQVVNQQAEIMILIIAPILITFLVFINWVVILLYSKQFISLTGMLYWAALGMFFKAASWSIGFIFLAKGTAKLFFLNELISNIYLLGLNFMGYYYGGLTGLGVSFLISYILHFIQMYAVTKIKFEFSFEYAFIKIFVVQFSLAIICFLLMNIISNTNHYFYGVVLILFSSVYSFRELDKRIDLRRIFNNFRRKE